jgi:hypothetical protein
MAAQVGNNKGMQFDENRVDASVTTGTTLEWVIDNISCVHSTRFSAVNRNI